MKKAVSFLLLILFLYSIAGIFISFKVQQFEVKKEIKLRLKKSVPKSELTLFSFHPSSDEYSTLQWIEDHEFRYNGKMYDIVYRSADSDGTLHFQCINDTKEEILFADLDEQVQKNCDSRSNPSAKNTLKLFSLLYISAPDASISDRNSTQIFRYSFCNFYSSPSSENPSPPPRTAWNLWALKVFTLTIEFQIREQCICSG